MLTYMTSISKYQQQDPSSLKLSSKRNSKRKQQQHGNLQKTPSNENLSSGDNGFFSGTPTLEPTEIELDFKKLADLYEWLGQRLDERKKELTNSLGQMKSYLEDLHSVDNRLMSIENELSTHLNPNQLPLKSDAVNNLKTESKRLEGDLNKLGADLETIRVKGKQLLNDESKSGAEEVKRQLNSLNDRYVKLNAHNGQVKAKMELHAANLSSFALNYATLEHNIEQKKEMLDIMSFDKASHAKMTINSELSLIDTQLKQIELMRNDLIKSDSNLLTQVCFLFNIEEILILIWSYFNLK